MRNIAVVLLVVVLVLMSRHCLQAQFPTGFSLNLSIDRNSHS